MFAFLHVERIRLTFVAGEKEKERKQLFSIRAINQTLRCIKDEDFV